MHLSIGDHVKVLNEAVEGIVCKIASEKQVFVRTEDGFDFLYPINELIKVSDEQQTVEYHLDKSELLKKIVSDEKKRRLTMSGKSAITYLKPYLERGLLANKRNDAVVEIDLHLHELVAYPERLNNWEKIYIQVEHCKNCIEEAMRLKIPDLVFIHGIGEGRLKEEIRSILQTYSNVDFFDGEYSKYGFGATQVKIRGLFT